MYKYLWRKFYDSGSDGEINASTILMTNFLLLLFQFVKSWQKVVGGWREVGFLTLNVGLWWLKLCYYVSWQEMRLKYLIFFSTETCPNTICRTFNQIMSLVLKIQLKILSQLSETIFYSDAIELWKIEIIFLVRRLQFKYLWSAYVQLKCEKL